MLPDSVLSVWRSLLGNQTATSDSVTSTTDNWQHVDLDTLGLVYQSVQLIKGGNDSYNSRSEQEYGAIRDLISVGCDDETICFVMTDPDNVISEKALEQAQGDVQAAMKRIANQVPKIRADLSRELTKVFADSDISEQADSENQSTGVSILNKLKQLSVTNRVDEMEKNLDNDSYIFPGLALNGQITLFYAKPNSGKTLLFIHFIREAIETGRCAGRGCVLCQYR